MNFRTVWLVSAASFAAASCSTWQAQKPAAALAPLASHGSGVETDAAACRERLASTRGGGAQALDAERLGIVSWNVKKGAHAHWRRDLAALAADKDLVLIQEAAVGPALLEALEPTAHWAFAPGYRAAGRATGVMTLSTRAPLAQCNLRAVEPWLRTPKATSVTEFGLSGTEATLVVANIHAVNFSLGLAEFRRQLDELRLALSGHAGPIILSGDFNTWRGARLELLGQLTDELGLDAIDFDEDHRTLVFGLPLDHLFVRGLAVRSATTQPVRTSDHNPLAAEFTLVHDVLTADRDAGDGAGLAL